MRFHAARISSRNSDTQFDKSWDAPGFEQNDRHPVVCVSWGDSEKYADWLARKTGKTYRLLSEAEWEYAARAGNSTAYHFGNGSKELCAYANGADRTWRELLKFSALDSHECRDGHARTAPVGSLKPNGWGLHDMHGNVREWVKDCWQNSYDGLPSDGSAFYKESCSAYVRRGGSWNDAGYNLRAARRWWVYPAPGYNDMGFRVARTIDP